MSRVISKEYPHLVSTTCYTFTWESGIIEKSFSRLKCVDGSCFKFDRTLSLFETVKAHETTICENILLNYYHLLSNQVMVYNLYVYCFQRYLCVKIICRHQTYHFFNTWMCFNYAQGFVLIRCLKAQRAVVIWSCGKHSPTEIYLLAKSLY